MPELTVIIAAPSRESLLNPAKSVCRESMITGAHQNEATNGSQRSIIVYLLLQNVLDC